MTYTEKVGLRRPKPSDGLVHVVRASNHVWARGVGVNGTAADLWDPIANARAAAEYWNKTFARRTREAADWYREQRRRPWQGMSVDTRPRYVLDASTRAGFEQMRDELR